MKDGISRIVSDSGKISIGAIDHRGSAMKLFHGDKEMVVEWKHKMVELYGDVVSGLLIDPVFGKDIVRDNPDVGWLMSLEKSGYVDVGGGKKTELLENWGVEELKSLGAVGGKLLLYYDPSLSDLAYEQKMLAKKVADDCDRNGVLFLLEPLDYGDMSDGVVLESVRELKELSVDIFKLRYPGTREECVEITRELDGVPWVLLSAGAEFDEFKEWLRIALESGASGMAVGRALWQEIGDMDGDEVWKFLESVAVDRLRELIDIVERYGRAVDY